MQNQQERRKTTRVKLDVALQIETAEGVQCNGAVVKNCGLDGLCYTRGADGTSLRGKEVFLTFSIEEGGEPIRVLAWVAHEEQVGPNIESGVTFMFLQPDHERHISQFVKTGTAA